MYKGYREVSEEELASFYENKSDLQLINNEFVIMGDNKFRYVDGNLIEIKPRTLKGNYIDKVKAKNLEQELAINLLLDDNIKCVVLLGKAGTGKTYLAVQAGLYKLEKCKNIYDKLFFVRNNIEITKPIGALPGEKFDKIKPFISSYVDNLNGWNVFYDLFDRGMIEVEALGYMQGRSIKNAYIVCDEAQNLTKEQIKMLVTRVGENSKIVFTGDVEQIISKEFKGEKNGLMYLVEKFIGQRIFGVVELIQSERSELAELASKIL